MLPAARIWRDDLWEVPGVVTTAGIVGVGVGVGSLIGVGRQQLVEFVVVEAGRVEGVAPTAMWQCEFGGGSQVVDVRVLAVVPCGMGDRCPRHHDVGPHPVDAGRRADFGDPQQCGVGELDSGQHRLGTLDPIAKPLFGIRISGAKGLRICIELQPTTYDFSALGRVPRRGNLDGEAEAVEELRAQLALFGIHRADQHELRRVGDRYAVAFHGDGAHRGRIEEQIDQVIVQQVDFVDVEDSAVRLGQQARFEVHRALAESLFEVDRSRDAILGGTDGKLHQAHGPGLHRLRPVRRLRRARRGSARPGRWRSDRRR